MLHELAKKGTVVAKKGPLQDYNRAF